jgi:hypothetical protein
LELEVRTGGLSAAALAFDSIARDFDERFESWRSVEAQRRAVRRALLDAFPAGARLIEIGGGTGTDALWMAEHGRQVLMTDAAPAMVAAASAKCGDRVRTAVAPAETIGRLPVSCTASRSSTALIRSSPDSTASPIFSRSAAGLRASCVRAPH